jgi:hypothetical protein
LETTKFSKEKRPVIVILAGASQAADACIQTAYERFEADNAVGSSLEVNNNKRQQKTGVSQHEQEM